MPEEQQTSEFLLSVTSNKKNQTFEPSAGHMMKSRWPIGVDPAPDEEVLNLCEPVDTAGSTFRGRSNTERK